MQGRLKFVSIGFMVASLVLIARLFYWQIIKSDYLSAQARAQHTQGSKITAQRGNILSQDGSWLAASTDSWVLFSFLPDFKENPQKVASDIAPLIALDPSNNDELRELKMSIQEALSRKDVTWVPLKKKLSTEVKKNVEALKIDGLGFDREEIRVYPESSSSAHLLGFVGKDDEGTDKGYFGLEGYYDLILAGKPGYMERESSALGAPILLGDSKKLSSQHGVDLITHIDKAMQLTAETKLKDGIERYGAIAGTVIIMDPKDGAVKAMASYPSYDQSKYYEFAGELYKNPSISDSFEPGSIFKPIIMASGLDAGVIDQDTKCDICSHALKIDKYLIQTWDDKYHADSSMTDIIVHSDNVGMSFIGAKLGKEKMYEYLTKFGLGSLTGIDLQGEALPPLRKKGEWGEIDIATASFGQGIAVTPIQMIKAVTIIARGGTGFKPQVVDKLRFEGWEEDIKPVTEARVISKKSAEQITQMMIAAVKNGEAKWTNLKGFSVAGKTGTAQIAVSGHYDAEKTNASFVGFAPANDPKFVMIVILREPQTSQWASETAAPLWFSIAKDLFSYLGIQPSN